MIKAFSTKEISIIGIFIAITAVLAQIAIPIPFTPAPVSFGLVAVYTSGILLKPSNAILTQICYLLLGAAGLPIFGNFKGGIGALFGATGGYLMTYPITAAIIAFTLNNRKNYRQSKKRLYIKAIISITFAHIIMYLGGTLWLSVITGNSFQAALAMAVYPFIPLDILKIVFCIVVIVPLRFRMLSMNLLLLDYD